MLESAVKAICQLDGYTCTAQSSVYETSPVGGPPQDNFLNLVLKVHTYDTPQRVLANVQSIESTLGRVRRETWGARSIDIDILIYDNWIVKEDDLSIPHPLFTERLFVMVPFMDVGADLIHPVLKKTIREIWESSRFSLEKTQRVIPFRNR
jgi:2-amino-4-hydroxy-6-hydroxymethyldihydropteridine diphosphokinase